MNEFIKKEPGRGMSKNQIYVRKLKQNKGNNEENVSYRVQYKLTKVHQADKGHNGGHRDDARLTGKSLQHNAVSTGRRRRN